MEQSYCLLKRVLNGAYNILQIWMGDKCKIENIDLSTSTKSKEFIYFMAKHRVVHIYKSYVTYVTHTHTIL